MKKKITRRNFVKTTIAGTAAVAVTPTIGCTNLGNPYDSKNLPTRMLGNTGVRVPLIGYGCGSRWMSEQNDDIALEILETALDNGIYYWDTASTYKNGQISSEERLGKILSTRRAEVFLVSKTGERDADKAREIIERSLKRMGTDYIDLYHVHSVLSVEDAESLGEKGKVLEVLHDYKSQGIIKHIGFTGHTSAEGMKRAAELYDLATDPGETTNLVADRPELVSQLEQRLEEFSPEWEPAVSLEEPVLDDETRAALRKLGYLD